MAAEYEVNIKLNTQQVERQLKSIDTRTKRTGRMATENINALAKAQDRRARLMNKINELESKGLNVAKLRKQMGKATEELAKRRFGSLQQEFRLLTRTLRLEESKLRILRQQQQGFPASPLRGTATMMGSPAQIAASARAGGPRSPIRGAANIAGSPEARRVRRQRLEQVGLGAGFPLLFGGGAGSVIGGGLGGLTGSFGAQIAFSAIGQQIDQFVAGMVDAGKALTSVGGAADFMAEKSLFSSDAMQFRIEKLIEEGEVSRAAALMTQEMAKQVGGSGLKALKDLGTEASKMGKLFSTLILQIQAFIAKGLTPLLSAINAVVGNITLNNQFNALIEEATGDRAREINEFLKPFTKKVGGQGGRKTKTIISEEGKRLAVEKFGGQFIPEGAAIEPTQLELLRAADAQSSQGEKEEARIQKRLGRLEEERKKVLEISRFKDKIAAAEMSRDEQLVIRLKGEQQIAEIEAKRKKDLVDITDQRLIDQININAATDKLTAVRDTERKLAEFDRERRQQRLDDMQKFIEQQYELNEAVKQQAAMAEGIAQAMGQGMTQSFDLLINGAKNWGSALRDIAANVLRDIARQLIQIYVIEQSIGFLKSFITPFSPSTPLGAGGGQVGRFGTLGPNYGIPQFANGGNPPVGRPSIVGERGPELFVPRTAGTIIPNHAMGGANVTVNVDASGSSVEGNADQASQLGKAIGIAVQQELVKQKRPGGLLAS